MYINNYITVIIVLKSLIKFYCFKKKITCCDSDKVYAFY